MHASGEVGYLGMSNSAGDNDDLLGAVRSLYGSSEAIEAQEIRQRKNKGVDGNSLALVEALEVIFTSECLILSEYLEFIVPAINASFVLAMVHLPSAQYRGEIAGIARDNVGGMTPKILVYALLELVLFVALAVVARYNCRIHAPYQLAVLETQKSIISQTDRFDVDGADIRDTAQHYFRQNERMQYVVCGAPEKQPTRKYHRKERGISLSFILFVIVFVNIQASAKS
ncbi:hypothetical protein ON010_g291 [Phytophthora cinnamomi]|nr:hypothetical protein ON010_g291 [Phytophthora cinnamomi]